MTLDRRDFIKSSAAITLLFVSKDHARGADLPILTPPRKIGVIHSTGLTLEFRNCLVAGLNSQGWRVPPAVNKAFQFLPTPASAGGNYGPGRHGPLKNLVDGMGAVDLIVAAGGLVAQASAYEALDFNRPDKPSNFKEKPFVYLSGRAPTTQVPTNGKYCGVNLNTSGSYVAAGNALGVDQAGIYLAQNANSEMAEAEKGDWPRVFQFFGSPPRTNDRTKYHDEVAALKKLNPTGVIVSSDPYFRSTATDFRNAMSTLNIPVCYPSKEFLPANKGILLPNSARLSSNVATDSDTAYFQLGLRAADVLDNQVFPNYVIPQQKLASVTWNVNSKMWDKFV